MEPPQKKRDPPLSTPFPSIPLNSPAKCLPPTANQTLNSTSMSLGASPAPNKSRQMLLAVGKRTETSLQQVLEHLHHPPPPQPAFPLPNPEAPEAKIHEIFQRYDSTACTAVIENLRENVSAAQRTQKEYLHATETLLVDACHSQETHGLSDKKVERIYQRLETVSLLEWEMSMRVKALDAVLLTLEKMSDTADQVTPDASLEDFATAEDLGEMFKKVFEQLVADGAKARKLSRIRRWRNIVAKRGLKFWTDEENGTPNEGNDLEPSRTGSDWLEDSSMNSEGDEGDSQTIV